MTEVFIIFFILVSEWMRRRLGGESEFIVAPPSSNIPSMQVKMPTSGGNKSGTIADLQAMITRLGMTTPGGPLSAGGNISTPSTIPVASSFSPVEPGELPTPPQPTGLGRI